MQPGDFCGDDFSEELIQILDDLEVEVGQIEHFYKETFIDACASTFCHYLLVMLERNIFAGEEQLPDISDYCHPCE